jgi:hypothetical protein
MRNLIVVLMIGSLVACGYAISESSGQPPQPKEKKEANEDKKDAAKPDREKIKELMTAKLDQSQKLFAALVMNDLDKAAKHAEELKRIRKEASWLIVKTRTYDMWSNDFTESADKIIKAAKDKNLDAARLGYLGMTTTCFNCHIYVRDLGDVRVEDFDR